MYCLRIDLTKKYATSVFRIMKREEIKKGAWPYPKDIRFEEWVLQEMGPEAVDLVPKQILETLPSDTGKYTDLEAVKLSNT